MKYLLDTCVISELVKPEPAAQVTSWLQAVPEQDLFLSVLTFGELHLGVGKLPVSRKKSFLHHWISYDLKQRFATRTLDIDFAVAKRWGTIQAKGQTQGRSMPAIDALIAATAIEHGLTLVTRNEKDMQASDVLIFNPWKERPGGSVGS